MPRRPQRRVALGLTAALIASGAATTGAAHAAELRADRNTLLVRHTTGQLQQIKVGAGLDAVKIARELRRHPGSFKSVGANLVASASAGATPGWVPNDAVAGVPWTELQWNFVGEWGVGATTAWKNLRTRNHGAGRGVVVAVIDSGLAYRDRVKYRASPDFPASQVTRGYDFVDEDRFPDDFSGHGTHVASTIAGATGNGAGLAGLAYRTKIMPIRVLNAKDEGNVLSIARGVRYAIKNGANLINLSVDFPITATAADIPEVMDAINEARDAGILVISSSGNDGLREVALPARAAAVLSVGGTTARGCRASYSNGGPALDLVAPGGGIDSVSSARIARCRPGEPGPPIAQVTLQRAGDPTTLGVPLDYVGTSMAAAHVTGIAAMVRASGILGTRHPSPNLLAAYLVRRTRDLGPKGRDIHYGAGLIDAEAATDFPGSARALRGAQRAALKAEASGTRRLAVR